MIWSVLAAVAAGLAVVCFRTSPLRRLHGTPDRGARGSPEVVGQRRNRLLGAAAVAGGGLLLFGSLGWWAGVVAAGLGIASYQVQGRLQTRDARRRREQRVAQLPQACDLLSVCLDAGQPPRQAVATIAHAIGGVLGDDLAEVSARIGLGVDEAGVWSELAATEPVLAPLGRELARGVGSGISLSQSLRAVGIESRREVGAAAEVRAKRVGVRSVLPLMVCFLPSFLLLGVVPIIGGVVQHLFR